MTNVDEPANALANSTPKLELWGARLTARNTLQTSLRSEVVR